MNNTTYSDLTTKIVAQPAGFTSKVVIRRTVDKNGRVRFHYWGRAHRWLPISAVEAMAVWP